MVLILIHFFRRQFILSEPIERQRVQLSLVYRFLKGKFFKISEILFDLVPIWNEG